MNRQPRLPKRITGPATIGLFAPSGSVNQEALARAVVYLESKGHRVIVTPQTALQWRYFAGTDQQRIDAFHHMVTDPTIDIMMSARGGYGWTRILHHIDFSLVAQSEKIFVGFSDFTAFNLAALAKSNLVTFAGPMASVDFGNGDVSAFMENNFWSLLTNASHQIDVIANHPYPQQQLEGQIWGNNLCLLVNLIGTPYFPHVDDGILFIEEIAEEPYAVERMLHQLFHTGILSKQKAIILGDFAQCKPSEKSRYPYEMSEVIESIRALLPIPVLTGLPFGHIKEKITIPIGGMASLNINNMGFQLQFSLYTK